MAYELGYIQSETKVLVTQSCLLVTPWTVAHQAPLSMEFSILGQNTGVGCHSLLHGIFLTQGLNLGPLHCRQTLYQLSHQGRHFPSPSANVLLKVQRPALLHVHSAPLKQRAFSGMCLKEL